MDEAHTVRIQGSSFRPEFKAAVKTLRLLYSLSPTKFPRIVMSATLLGKDRTKLAELFGAKFNFEVCTSMNKRRIFFEVVAVGNPTQSTATCIKHDLQHDPLCKII